MWFDSSCVWDSKLFRDCSGFCCRFDATISPARLLHGRAPLWRCIIGQGSVTCHPFATVLVQRAVVVKCSGPRPCRAICVPYQYPVWACARCARVVEMSNCSRVALAFFESNRVAGIWYWAPIRGAVYTSMSPMSIPDGTVFSLARPPLACLRDT